MKGFVRCFSCCPCCKNLTRKYKVEDTTATGSGVTTKTAVTSGVSSTSVAGGSGHWYIGTKLYPCVIKQLGLGFD